MFALLNFNQQLSNQWVAIGQAAASSALDTFNIDNFFPQPNKNIGLKSILNGIGPVVAQFFGLTPLGPFVTTANTLLGPFGLYITNKVLDAQDPDLAQKLFAPRAKAIYRNLGVALEQAAITLFRGGDVNGVRLTDVLAEGAWVDTNTLSLVNDLVAALNIEITSRGINALWKTFPSNKMWILFVDLGDVDSNATCIADTSGPPDAKYCADQGVYYAYNFIESASYLGYVGYPWGADKLNEVDLNFHWVTEASAKSYRYAKASGAPDLFNLNYTTVTSDFFNITRSNTCPDTNNCAGRYPGTWTLPVCNASTWGRPHWNFNYNATDYAAKMTNDITRGPRSGGHPPCLCGPRGTETAAWANAAGMHEFQTYYQECERALKSKDFTWPPNVDSVDLGFGVPIRKK